MKILWLATKAPWPPIDGGRQLMHNTLRALAARGHEITLVAPVDPVRFSLDEVERQLRDICRPQLIAARPRRLITAALQAQLERHPVTVVRHRRSDVRTRVASLLDHQKFDVIQLEQVQAIGALSRLPKRGLVGDLPVVLRAQNVESDLWRSTALHRRFLRPLLCLEAHRLARFEGEVMCRVAKTLALTREDAVRLQELAGGEASVEVVPAPFVSELPPAAQRLAGEPAIVLFGSGGWLPNREGACWFVDEIWPHVREALPGAVLHGFGLQLPTEVPGIVVHPSPTDSQSAMPEGAMLAVPLHIASGVRIKILEGWARGLPVVATPTAARGLDAEHGREVWLAEDGASFAEAFRVLASDAVRWQEAVAAGRSRLDSTHGLERIAVRLEQIYGDLV